MKKTKFLAFAFICPLLLTGCFEKDQNKNTSFKDDLVFTEKITDEKTISSLKVEMNASFKQQRVKAMHVSTTTSAYSELVHGTENVNVDYTLYRNSVNKITTRNSEFYRYGVTEKLADQTDVEDYWMYNFTEGNNDTAFLFKFSGPSSSNATKELNVSKMNASLTILPCFYSLITSHDSFVEEMYSYFGFDTFDYSVYRGEESGHYFFIYSYQEKEVKDVDSGKDTKELVTASNYQAILECTHSNPVSFTYFMNTVTNRDTTTNAWYDGEKEVFSLSQSISFEYNEDAEHQVRTEELFNRCVNYEKVILGATLSYKVAHYDGGTLNVDDFSETRNAVELSTVYAPGEQDEINAVRFTKKGQLFLSGSDADGLDTIYGKVTVVAYALNLDGTYNVKTIEARITSNNGDEWEQVNVSGVSERAYRFRNPLSTNSPFISFSVRLAQGGNSWTNSDVAVAQYIPLD